MRKRLAVYPFYPKLFPIVKHFNSLQEEYEIIEVYASRGLGIIGKDIAYICNHPSVA